MKEKLYILLKNPEKDEVELVSFQPECVDEHASVIEIADGILKEDCFTLNLGELRYLKSMLNALDDLKEVSHE